MNWVRWPLAVACTGLLLVLLIACSGGGGGGDSSQICCNDPTWRICHNPVYASGYFCCSPDYPCLGDNGKCYTLWNPPVTCVACRPGNCVSDEVPPDSLGTWQRVQGVGGPDTGVDPHICTKG